MPLVGLSTYRAPRFLSNSHLQTILPSLLRRVEGVTYERERIDTPDGDFLDLDWSRKSRKRLVLVLHGMEGDSRRPYVLGMVRCLNRGGWDAVAMNFRGCSEEVNRLPRFYHGGDTADLELVLDHIERNFRYDRIALVGFSMGGNVILKYLGERGTEVRQSIEAGVAFSVPCHIASGVARMGSPGNRLYVLRFMKMLRKKIEDKARVMPESMNTEALDRIRTLEEFDDFYTARFFGFRDAAHLYAEASCAPWLSRISVPTLLVNAADDPFLSQECYPMEAARNNPFLHLEIPEHGGHVGFITLGKNGDFWSERRALEFIDSPPPRAAPVKNGSGLLG